MTTAAPTRTTRPATPHPDCTSHRHHTASAYDTGCRCPEAREARRLVRKRRREGRHAPQIVPVLGVARRLQALAALGWTCALLAERLGVTHTAVNHLRRRVRPTVTRSTADRVAHLYETLSGTRGPSRRTADIAARNGWAPPLAWDDHDLDDPAARPRTPARDHDLVDPVAVEQATRGVRVRLTTTERALAVRRARTLGLTAGETALRLHVDTRTVQRLLATTA